MGDDHSVTCPYCSRRYVYRDQTPDNAA
jgi:uncharacterized Zn-finger protein